MCVVLCRNRWRLFMISVFPLTLDLSVWNSLDRLLHFSSCCMNSRWQQYYYCTWYSKRVCQQKYLSHCSKIFVHLSIAFWLYIRYLLQHFNKCLYLFVSRVWSPLQRRQACWASELVLLYFFKKPFCDCQKHSHFHSDVASNLSFSHANTHLNNYKPLTVSWGTVSPAQMCVVTFISWKHFEKVFVQSIWNNL